jgi:hypothetical protein
VFSFCEWIYDLLENWFAVIQIWFSKFFNLVWPMKNAVCFGTFKIHTKFWCIDFFLEFFIERNGWIKKNPPTNYLKILIIDEMNFMINFCNVRTQNIEWNYKLVVRILLKIYDKVLFLDFFLLIFLMFGCVSEILI